MRGLVFKTPTPSPSKAFHAKDFPVVDISTDESSSDSDSPKMKAEVIDISSDSDEESTQVITVTFFKVSCYLYTVNVN